MTTDKKVGPKEVVDLFTNLQIEDAVAAFAEIKQIMHNSLIGERELAEKRACWAKDLYDKLLKQ